MNHENKMRERICELALSMFQRGLTFGASGNISVRLDNGWLMTPTGSTMGNLDPARLSRLDANGRLISGDKPTKEAFLHQTMYDCRHDAEAVVHLHSSHATAVSCLDCEDCTSVLPPLTPYFVMRVGQLPMVPYFPPGDPDLAGAVGKLAGEHHAVLLANHGPVVAGTSLDNAAFAMEELEETAKLFLLLQGMRTRPLDTAQVDELNTRFGKK
jgi:ribulose-5-phosphate 4-epimerase/fuculose-1-phosphate aldolase